MFKTLRFVTIAALVALPSTLAGNPAGGGGINGSGVSTGGGGGANGTGASGTTSTGGVTSTSTGGVTGTSTGGVTGTSGNGVNGTNSTTGGTSARQCPLVLSSTSTDQWQIGCTEGFQASSGAITFDASKFQLVRVSSDATVTTLKPETKPTELTVPKSLAKVDALASSSITSFSFDGVNGSTVEFNTACFTKMTTLRKVSVTSTTVTINGPLELPPSLNEITFQRTGLVDFKVKIDKNATYNITKIDLGYNRLRYIPLVILASPTLVSANLEGNDLAPLRLSTRKLRRFAYLVVTKRLSVGSIADFNQTCADGETKSVKVGARTVAVCQVPKDEDDDLVADSDESADAGGDSASSSIITQTNTTTTTTISSNGTVTVKNTTTVTTQKPGDAATKTNAASMRSWSFGIACLGLVASLVL